MNVEELVERAKAFSKKHGVPITKNEFEGTVDDPVPPLPYIVYLLSHETGRGADGLNNLKAQDIDFELYTAEDNQERKDLAAAFRGLAIRGLPSSSRLALMLSNTDRAM